MPQPSLIALDWGTSSMRAYLLGQKGEVLEERSEPWGIMNVPNGDFSKAYDTVVGGWKKTFPYLKAITAGMIGSTSGWKEAPYCQTPAGSEELADKMAYLAEADLYIIPGIASFNDRPNVMRGEETQIAGALQLDPSLEKESLIVMPGTHSKWVNIHEGKVISFDTYMTGEIFSVLSQHTILGRPSQDCGKKASPDDAEKAFNTGVQTARESKKGVSPLLFSTRANFLAGKLKPEATLDYLSGLLIGEEIRCGLFNGLPGQITLIGNEALCKRYLRVLDIFEVSSEVKTVTDAAQAGLWRIANRAGLPVFS